MSIIKCNSKCKHNFKGMCLQERIEIKEILSQTPTPLTICWSKEV